MGDVIEIIGKSVVGCCCLLFWIAGIAGWVWHYKLTRAKNRVLREGRAVVAWIVQANNALFEPGTKDYPAQVVYSFDANAANTPGYLKSIAEAVARLKRDEPVSEIETAVAKLVRNEGYYADRREQLPLGFTNGVVVYSAAVMFERRFLPGGRLTLPYVYCQAHPDENVTCMLPYPNQGG